MPMSNPGTTGLVEWMALGEASGNRVGSHAASVFSEASSSTNRAGKIGNALDSPGYLNGPTGLFDLSPTQSGTVCQWVYLDTIGGQLFPSAAWNGGGNWGTYIHGTAAKFFTTDAVEAATPSGAVSSGAWFFMACWYDHTVGANGTVYVQIDNGTIYSSACATGPSNTRTPQLGTLQSGFGTIDGALDEWCWWSRVLTADEREWLYNSGSGRSYADLTATGAKGLPIIMHHHHAVYGGG